MRPSESPMRRLRRAAVVAAVPALAVALAAWLLLDGRPALDEPSADEPAPMLARLGHLVRVHDPRRAVDGLPQRLVLRVEELRWIARLAGRSVGGIADATLAPGRVEVRASVPVLRRRAWLNTSITGQAAGATLRVSRLRVGSIELTGAAAHHAAMALLALWERVDGAAPPLDRMVDELRSDGRHLVVAYRWPPGAAKEFVAHVADRWWPGAQQPRWRAHHEALLRALQTSPYETDLTGLLGPMFELARQRSGGDAARAVEENRTALVTLALYLLGRPVSALMPAARGWTALPPRHVVLDGRDDFPRHLLLSAVLAAEADGPLADAVGLAKEVDDARFGSGFSFTDVAANRAGARLGAVAVRDPLRLQSALAGGVAAGELLPPVGDLPEFLHEREFVARFGGVGTAAYRRMVDEIDARIAALPLLR